MKQQNEFNSEHEQSPQLQQQSAREFATPEELLRYDARQNMVPPGLAQRLKQSSAGIARPARPWWRRLFGR
jgi:hypothetical protein